MESYWPLVLVLTPFVGAVMVIDPRGTNRLRGEWVARTIAAVCVCLVAFLAWDLLRDPDQPSLRIYGKVPWSLLSPQNIHPAETDADREADRETHRTYAPILLELSRSNIWWCVAAVLILWNGVATTRRDQEGATVEWFTQLLLAAAALMLLCADDALLAFFALALSVPILSFGLNQSPHSSALRSSLPPEPAAPSSKPRMLVPAATLLQRLIVADLAIGLVLILQVWKYRTVMGSWSLRLAELSIAWGSRQTSVAALVAAMVLIASLWLRTALFPFHTVLIELHGQTPRIRSLLPQLTMISLGAWLRFGPLLGLPSLQAASNAAELGRGAITRLDAILLITVDQAMPLASLLGALFLFFCALPGPRTPETIPPAAEGIELPTGERSAPTADLSKGAHDRQMAAIYLLCAVIAAHSPELLRQLTQSAGELRFSLALLFLPFLLAWQLLSTSRLRPLPMPLLALLLFAAGGVLPLSSFAGQMLGILELPMTPLMQGLSWTCWGMQVITALLVFVPFATMKGTAERSSLQPTATTPWMAWPIVLPSLLFLIVTAALPMQLLADLP